MIHVHDIKCTLTETEHGTIATLWPEPDTTRGAMSCARKKAAQLEGVVRVTVHDEDGEFRTAGKWKAAK